MSATTRWYYEARLGELLGLKQEDLKFLRTDLLEKEKTWDLDGRDVVISQRGLEQLLEFIGSTTSQRFDAIDFSSAEKKVPTDGLTELVVIKTFPNPRLVLARMIGDPLQLSVTVQVPNSVNFRAGMKLKGRQIRPGVFRMEGRCPRYPGRY